MCDKYIDNISLLIDDMLDNTAKEELLSHFDTCANCKQVYNNLVAITNALNNLDDIETPHNLHSSIMSKINEVKKTEPKIIKIDFRNKALYAVASIIGLMVIFTPVVSTTTMQNTPKTTVMASDLNLYDHIRIFGENPVLQKNVSVSVSSADIDSTFNDLTSNATSYGNITFDEKFDDVATFTIETSIENAPQYVSYIVDNYSDTIYSTSSNKVTDEIKQLDATLQKSTKVNAQAYSAKKEEIASKPGMVTINVTVHK